MGGDATASGGGFSLNGNGGRAGGGACGLLAERVSDLLAGDLPLAMRRELESHAAGCATCSAELAAAARTVAALRALPVAVRRDAVWSSLSALAASQRAPALFALGARSACSARWRRRSRCATTASSSGSSATSPTRCASCC
jgi:hypothetical protein